MPVARACPTPVRITACVPAWSVKLSVPETGPRVAGANSTVTWQVPGGVKPVPHVLAAMEKGGVMATLAIAIGVFTPTDGWGGLEVPSVTPPKASAPGVKVTWAVEVPTPATPTVNRPPQTLA